MSAAQRESKASTAPALPACLPSSTLLLQFVFRQGSPLDPAALKMVAAPDSRRIIVCSDYMWVQDSRGGGGRF